MGCTKAQVLLLLERIESEMIDERDKAVVREYIERLRRSGWSEIEKDLFSY